jgi:antitoxin ParD1/3/4
MVTTALPADLSQFVESEVAAGRYASPDEVLQAALRLLKERQEKWRRLKADIDEGVAALERGDYITLETPEDRKALFDDIIRRGRERMGLPQEEE